MSDDHYHCHDHIDHCHYHVTYPQVCVQRLDPFSLSHGGALQFLVTIMSSRETWVVSDSGLLCPLQQSQCQHGSRCWWGDWMVANLVLATADLHALLRDLLLNGGRSCPAPRRLGAPLLGQRGVGVQLGVLHHHAGVLAQIVDMLLLF